MLDIQVQGLQNIWEEEAEMSFYVNRNLIENGCYISAATNVQDGNVEKSSYIAVNFVDEMKDYGATYVLYNGRELAPIELQLIIEKILDMFEKSNIEMFKNSLNKLAIEVISTSLAETQNDKHQIMDYLIYRFDGLKNGVVIPPTETKSLVQLNLAVETSDGIWGVSAQHQFTNAHTEVWFAKEIENRISFTGEGLNNPIEITMENIEKHLVDIHQHLTVQKNEELYAVKDINGDMVCLDEEEVYWFLSILKSAHNTLLIKSGLL